MRNQIYSSLQEPNFLQLLPHTCYFLKKMKVVVFQQVHRFELSLWILAKDITQYLHARLYHNVNPSNIVDNC